MRKLRRGSVFKDFDAVSFEGGEKMIQLFGRMFFGRERAIHFIAEQIAAVLTYSDKVADLVVLFLGHEHEGLSPSSHWQNCPSLLLNPAALKHGRSAPPK